MVLKSAIINITRSTNLLATSQGLTDPMQGSINNHIGDQVNISGISIKMMLELNERYSDVTFRIFVVKCAKGDVPTDANLWNNQSANRMIDTINTERFSIVASKTLKMTAPNHGNVGTMGTGGFITGDQETFSRATRIVKMWIPGKKFGRNGKITYENGTSQVKFFDYCLMVYAYSNIATAQALNWTVGRVNDEVIRMFYKDA